MRLFRDRRGAPGPPDAAAAPHERVADRTGAPRTPPRRRPQPASGAAPTDDAGAAPDTAEPAPGDGETGGDEPESGDGAGGESDGDGTYEPQLLEIVLIRELLHSPTAFTQGLEISGGRLYESTGARADRASTLRELDRDTGDVLRLHEIEEDVFAEGITFVDDRIYQLTWKDGVALVWDPEPEEFAEVERFSYEGQGVGAVLQRPRPGHERRQRRVALPRSGHLRASRQSGARDPRG